VNDGKIWLHRKILDSDLWALPSAHIIVALVCLLKANWEDRMVRGLVIRRGQWLTHREDIAGCCPKDVTERVVRRALSNLAKLGFLVREVVFISGRRFLLVTICKYNEYQTSNARAVRSTVRSTVRERSDGGPLAVRTLTEEVKEGEEGKETNKLPLARELVDLWHTTCPTRPKITEPDKIADKVRSRLREHPDTEWWLQVFRRCATSDFLSDKKWLSLHWLIENKLNALKVYEGNYGGDPLPPKRKFTHKPDVPPTPESEWIPLDQEKPHD